MTKTCTLIHDFLDEHKIENLEVIDVKEHTPFASYYILGTCGNTRQLGATADILEDFLEQHDLPVRCKNGTNESGWVIVDCGSVVVHLFLEGMRNEIDLASVVTPKRKSKK